MVLLSLSLRKQNTLEFLIFNTRFFFPCLYVYYMNCTNTSNNNSILIYLVVPHSAIAGNIFDCGHALSRRISDGWKGRLHLREWLGIVDRTIKALIHELFKKYYTNEMNIILYLIFNKMITNIRYYYFILLSNSFFLVLKHTLLHFS